MGNHEYCTGCEENDFHYGQPCNPKKAAAVKAAKAEREREQALAKKAAERFIQKLAAMGIEAELGEYDKVVIRSRTLLAAENKK